MPSYTQYMRQMAAMDASDDDIESWITVKGNHIPIKKGQSKEDAVKSFIEGKKKNLVENHNSLVEAMNLEEKGYFKKDPRKRDSITQSAIEMGKEEKNLEELMEFGVKEANSAKSEKKENGRYERPTHISEPLKDVISETKAKMEKKEPTAAEKHTTTRNLLTMFGKHYDDLYEGKTKRNSALVKEFDDKMANDPEFKKQVQAFVRERGDLLTSDREVEAYMLAYNTVKNKLEPANKKLEEYHKKDTEKKSYNDKGLYQDALNELDDQIADKEKELENIHLAMTQNAEAGYFDIANSNMMDIEFVEGQLKELKKKREKLAGSGEKEEPHYFHKWTIESEKPHNLTNEQIQEKLNFYRHVRSNGRSDDNELLDKIHDLSDELKRRMK